MTEWLRVKNWREHQHYGKRRPPWIKLHRAMLEDYAVAGLPDVAKAHLMGIWLLAVAEDGRVPNDPEWVARHINATEPINLQVLICRGLLIPEPTASTTSQATLAHDASVDVKSTLEQGRGREEAETEAEAEAENPRRLLPQDYRTDFDALQRGSHNLESFRLEVATLVRGKHPKAEGATPEEVGRAMRELALAGGRPNQLASFVWQIVKRRQEKERDEHARTQVKTQERRKREEQMGERGGKITPLSELLPKLGIVPDQGAA